MFNDTINCSIRVPREVHVGTFKSAAYINSKIVPTFSDR